ncbi:putative RING-H2 finger protein ATL61 [Hibiscus syriacus]|uniref:putative RING-H2 finger protein ATL61 n=1 Tax=Hibiscus syriacus TaxID=106335 RepID=UPI00192494B5|nr:putative RING-H2 finger protein ATL61 [Hibiscus syriacus]
MAIIIAVILLFLGIGMLVILHICIVGGSFIMRGFRSPLRFDVNNNNHKNRAMSEDDIQKLPCYDYKAKDREKFLAPSLGLLLPLCKHSFHAECVDSWLLRNPICPICRTGASSGKPGSVLGEQPGHQGEDFVELREHHSRGSTNLDDVRIEVRKFDLNDDDNINTNRTMSEDDVKKLP